MTNTRRKLGNARRLRNPLKPLFVALAVGAGLVFAVSCVWGILFFSQLWIYAEPDPTVRFDQDRYMILASATDAQRYDLYDSKGEKRLDDVRGYAKQKRKGYVFNENRLAVIDEKSGLIEIKPLAEADETERGILEKASRIDQNRQP